MAIQLIGPPIPPKMQQKIGEDKLQASYDGSTFVVRHIWDNYWLDAFFGAIVLFFIFVGFLYFSVAWDMLILIFVIFIMVLIAFGVMAYKKSKE